MSGRKRNKQKGKRLPRAGTRGEGYAQGKGGRLKSLATVVREDLGGAELSWKEAILPELAWIAIGVQKQGGDYDQAMREIKNLTRWFEERNGRGKSPPIVFASAWRHVGEEDRAALRKEVRKGRWRLLSRGADGLRKVFAETPLGGLAPEPVTKQRKGEAGEGWAELADAIEEGQGTDNRMGMFLRGTILVWMVSAIRIKIQQGLRAADPETMEAGMRNEDSEKGRVGGSILRAMTLGSFQILSEKHLDKNWAAEFWGKCRRGTPCMLAGAGYGQPPWERETWEAFHNVQAEMLGFAPIVEEHVTDLIHGGERTAENDFRTVAEAMLAREASLFLSLALNPMIWTATSAPMTLRAMVEGIIDLKFIAADPQTRAAQYINHGMEQENLFLFQLEENMRSKEKGTEERRVLEEMVKEQVEIGEKFIRERKAVHLTDITPGGWNNKTLRARAMEVGEESLYNMVYQRWSAPMHNAWSHLMRFNSRECLNPLHLRHRVGDLSYMWREWHPDFMLRACKYLEMAIDLFREEFGHEERALNLCKAFVKTVEEHFPEWLTEYEKKSFGMGTDQAN